MANTDTDTDARYYPQPPPSPLTQVAQMAQPRPPTQLPPPSPEGKDPTRLPGGGISFHSGNLGISGGPDTAPVGNVPLPQPRPPEAPAPPQTPQQLPQVTVKPPQAYVPSPVRPMERWGDDYWAIKRMQDDPYFSNTQFMPTEREAPGVLRGANKQLAAWSAPAIAGPAGIIAGLASIIGPFFDFFSNNAFSRRYREVALGGSQQQMAELRMQEMRMKMREDEMKAKREHMMDLQDDLTKIHYDMLTDYRSVFDRAGPGGDLTQEQATEEIRALNDKWHHQNLNIQLQNGGLGAVSKALDLEHQKFMHSWAGNTSMRSADKTRKEQEKEREKEEKRAEMEAPYRDRPEETGAAAGAKESGGVMGYTPPQAAEGTTPPEAAPAAPDTTQSPALNRAKAAGFNPAAINGVAEKMLFGDFKSADEKNNSPRVVSMAREREMEMRRQLTDIQADENLKNKQDVFNAVNAVSPRLRGQVEGLVNGAIDPPQKSNESKAPWPEIFAAARKADPNLDTYLATRKKTLVAFATGRQAAEEKVLGTTYAHGDALLNKLHNMPDVFYQVMAEASLNVNVPIVGEVGLGWIKRGLQRTGNWFPETEAAIAKLEGDILTFSGESGAILASGVASTSGTEKERGALLKMINWRDPASAIAAVQDRMDRLRDRQTHLGMEYSNNTGMSFKEHMERFKHDNPEAAEGLTKIERDQDKQRKKAVDYRTVFPD